MGYNIIPYFLICLESMSQESSSESMHGDIGFSESSDASKHGTNGHTKKNGHANVVSSESRRRYQEELEDHFLEVSSSRGLQYQSVAHNTDSQIDDLRAGLAEESERLYDFISPLEGEIKRIARFRARSPQLKRSLLRKVAELSFSIIRQLAHRETGIFSLEPSVSHLLSALYAGPAESVIVTGLLSRAKRVVSSLDSKRQLVEKVALNSDMLLLDSYDVNRELDELSMLLRWYVKRKMSLVWLGSQDYESSAVGFDSDSDALFGFQVLHDQQVFGTKGCVVSSGVRLIGRDGQTLWIRAGVECDGHPVAARSEWSSWVDASDDSFIENDAVCPPFASLVPLRPNSQRVVVDDVQIFIPYAGLDLPQGRSQVTLVVSILDSEGRVIVEKRRDEELSVPKRELSKREIVAPHIAGFWPHDVVSGDKISDLKVDSGYCTVDGWEQLSVSVSCNLALALHSGESVVLETRFLDQQGNSVEFSSSGLVSGLETGAGFTGEDSGFRFRRILQPRSAWAHYENLSFNIPVEFLLLPSGDHLLTCEVVAMTLDDQILCGDLSQVKVSVPVSEQEINSSTRVFDGPIEVESVDVEPNWKLAEHDVIRIQATLAPRISRDEVALLAVNQMREGATACRVVVSLEREDGATLVEAYSDALGVGVRPVSRAVICDGQSGLAEQIVVCNLLRESVLNLAATSDLRRQGKIALKARVRVSSLEGKFLAEETREFFVRLTNTLQPSLPQYLSDPHSHVVDVTTNWHDQPIGLSCRVTCNVSAVRLLERGLMLEVSAGRGPVKGDMLGRYRLPIPGRAFKGLAPSGLVQVALEFDLGQSAVSRLVDNLSISIVSSNGMVLDTVHHPIASAAQTESPNRVSPVKPAEELEEQPLRSKWIPWFRKG